MKKIAFFSIVFFISINLIYAQVPQGFNYQATVKNSNGQVISGQNVSVRVSILEGSSTGTAVYTETHAVQTSTTGLIDLKIGEGQNPSSDFTKIRWGTDKFYVKIEMDETGGTSYTSLGASQLSSVPYALVASNLGTDRIYTTTDTLFVVKDNTGNVVFAVFPDGVQVIVNETVKGNIGGFAVSGRNPTKAGDDLDILKVTPDSTRVIFNESAKGNIGGFAVSGRNPTKAGISSLVNLFPDNYFIGHESGLNTTGLYNSFFGYNAGLANTTGSRNIFIGYESGYSNTYGSDNLILGNRAGYSNLLGINNVFMGNEAGYSNTGGSANMFFGYQSGYENTTGDHNTFIGYQSGHLNEEGFYNVYIGYQSGYTSGIDGIYKNYRNVFIGPFAGYSSSGVGESVYIGYDAGRYNVNGARNTFVGGNSGENNTVGYDNSFYGNASGEFSKGVANTYIGSAAGWSDTASYRCTYVGVRAGQAMVAQSFRNTFVGGWAGQNKTAGNQNTLIGFGAGQDSGIGFGNVFLGYMAGKNEQGSNKLYIDNWETSTPLIYGNFSNDSIIINGDFHVEGNVTATGTIVPDYVFENDYYLESIEEHAYYMWNKKHLPALKSAKEIEQAGRINMNERREQMLEELEKAHIYIEQLHERIKVLETEKSKFIDLKNKFEDMEKMFNQLLEKE